MRTELCKSHRVLRRRVGDESWILGPRAGEQRKPHRNVGVWTKTGVRAGSKPRF